MKTILLFSIAVVLSLGVETAKVVNDKKKANPSSPNAISDDNSSPSCRDLFGGCFKRKPKPPGSKPSGSGGGGFGFSLSSKTCFSEHNAYRKQNRRGALTWDSKLAKAAAGHNSVMASKRCFQHQCPGEPQLGARVKNAGYTWSRVGENIAMGQRSCTEVMTGWMNSPGHRQNILGDFKSVGCHQSGAYWTCVFGTPMPRGK